MSVRATGSLIADPVTVSALPGSPRMVVLSVDEDKKEVTTVWFADDHSAQKGVFPAASLDRVDLSAKPAARKK